MAQGQFYKSSLLQDILPVIGIYLYYTRKLNLTIKIYQFIQKFTVYEEPYPKMLLNPIAETLGQNFIFQTSALALPPHCRGKICIHEIGTNVSKTFCPICPTSFEIWRSKFVTDKQSDKLFGTLYMVTFGDVIAPKIIIEK